MLFDIFKTFTTVTPRELLGKFLYDMIIVWGLAIPTAIFGFMDENHPCGFCEYCDGKRAPDMSMWLKVTALSSFAVTGVDLVVLLIVSFGKKSISYLQIIKYLFYFEIEFFFFWWIWGFMVTLVNGKCIHQGVGMAIMSIIQLVLGGLRFYYIRTPTYIINEEVSTEEVSTEDMTGNYIDLENQDANPSNIKVVAK